MMGHSRKDPATLVSHPCSQAGRLLNPCRQESTSIYFAKKKVTKEGNIPHASNGSHVVGQNGDPSWKMTQLAEERLKNLSSSAIAPTVVPGKP